MLLLSRESLVEDIGYHRMVQPQLRRDKSYCQLHGWNSRGILEQLPAVNTRCQLTKVQTARSHSLSNNVSRQFSYFPGGQFSLNSPGKGESCPTCFSLFAQDETL